MDLKDIVSVAGIAGLHKIVGQRPSGLILETLDESKKRFPTSLTQKVSILEDIAMFTTDGEVRLRDVIIGINDKEKEGLALPDKNADNDALRNFLGAVLPNFDRERVYVSDIKKLVSWYGMLKGHLDFEAMKADSQKEAEGGEETAEKETKATAEHKPTAEVPKVRKEKPAKVSTPRTNAPVKKTTAPRKTGGGG